MRTLPAALAAAALCVSLTHPAEATPAGVFTGNMRVNCFGCGASPANADMIFQPTGPAVGNFVVNASGGACFVSWAFAGRIDDATGWVNVNVVVAGGDMTITGVDNAGNIVIGGGHVVPTSGPFCGGPADFEIVGWLA